MLTGMSSESEGSHSGPYGAAWITSLSWFSGKSESAKKCMEPPVISDQSACLHIVFPCSSRRIADWDFALSFREMPYLARSQILTGYATLARSLGLSPERMVRLVGLDLAALDDLDARIS